MQSGGPFLLAVSQVEPLICPMKARRQGELVSAGKGLPQKPQKIDFGRKAPKSLVSQSSFSQSGHFGIGEFVEFVMMGVYRFGGGPYNPLIAEERGARRRRVTKQATEIEE
ncbi:MAG: hypothetical protein ABS74_01310 [Pelagibacterium sp. SCN 63-126]|nr:MAG: hypothetical protein ABS74_01310 [Pelagibacterium sp. SCN 63-126]